MDMWLVWTIVLFWSSLSLCGAYRPTSAKVGARGGRAAS